MGRPKGPQTLQIPIQKSNFGAPRSAITDKWAAPGAPDITKTDTKIEFGAPRSANTAKWAAPGAPDITKTETKIEFGAPRSAFIDKWAAPGAPDTSTTLRPKGLGAQVGQNWAKLNNFTS